MIMEVMTQNMNLSVEMRKPTLEGTSEMDGKRRVKNSKSEKKPQKEVPYSVFHFWQF